MIQSESLVENLNDGGDLANRRTGIEGEGHRSHSGGSPIASAEATTHTQRFASVTQKAFASSSDLGQARTEASRKSFRSFSADSADVRSPATSRASLENGFPMLNELVERVLHEVITHGDLVVVFRVVKDSWRVELVDDMSTFVPK